MQSESPEIQVHRMGNAHPVDGSLVFFRYKRGKEVWVTPERLTAIRQQHRRSGAKQRARPEVKQKMKAYLSDYSKLPKQKAKQSARAKTPEYQARIRQKWATDPEMRRKARIQGSSPTAKQTRAIYRKVKADAIRDQRREYLRQKRATDPHFRLVKNLRSRVQDAVKGSGTRKVSRTKDLLGCSFEFFRGWIESKFERGMSWQNYGFFWHIDHIRPVASYNLLNEDEQRACFHYTNTQPLWKLLNLSKGDKMPDGSTRGRELRKTQLN